MPEGVRRTGSPALRILRRCLPVLFSAGLIAWVVHRVRPGQLAEAAAVLNWPALVLLTLAELAALLLWDTLCLTWLFSLPDGQVPLATAFRARCHSYAWTVINYGVGQGFLAWELSRIRGLSFAAALGRCILLALHDLAIVFGLGLASTIADPEPRLRPLRGVCAVGLLVLAGLALTLAVVPGRWRARLGHRVDWLTWWRPRHSAAVLGLRLIFFLIILFYLGMALRVIDLPQDARGTFGVLPLYLLAETLPSVSGLGARDVFAVGLLQPPPERVGAMVLFTQLWTWVLLFGRLTLGLASWWLAPGPGAAKNHEPRGP